MAIAKIEAPPKSHMGAKIVPWEKRHAAGKDLRRAVPRESLAAELMSPVSKAWVWPEEAVRIAMARQ
jgi:hypothetical protein